MSVKFIVLFYSFFILLPVLGFAQENQNKPERYEHLKMFSDVLHTVEKSYIQEVPMDQLINGAIKGVMKELDPHSHFLSKEQLKMFTKEAKGQFSGLGIEVAINKQNVIVISVLEKSPASKAGMKPGHIILQVNNKKTVGLNRMEVSRLLSGHRGKQFDIVVKDPDSKKVHQIQLRSKLISFKSVLHKDLGNQFLYMRIYTFTERTLQEIRKVMNKYKSPAGLILDLRGNPGGLFNSAVKVADLFIKKGTIVSIKGRIKDHEKIFKAHSPDTLTDFPILVLIDTYSASAAEILAGALKENKRAIILGRKSFGKGSVQSLIPINKDNAVKLTVAHYYTPDGNSIHNQGIKPNIELKAPKSSDGSKNIRLTSKEDTDFHQAVSFLKMSNYFKPAGF